MPASLSTGAFAGAFLLTVLMGFAIQRGATCTVAAVDEIVGQRRAGRLLAMLEASLWVAGGLLIASLLHLATPTPMGVPLSARLVAGGVLLGLGAFVNRACVFGAIARLSNGEWAYFATPVGFFAGCALLQVLPLSVPPAQAMSPVLASASSAVWLFAALIALRAVQLLWRARGVRSGIVVWTPSAATVVIGIAFVLLLLLVGASWAYTDVLAELARGHAMDLDWRLLLLGGLYSGGLLGGYSAGHWQRRPLRLADVARCLAGGLLMGVGSLLIPGSNDGLILLGMPLLLPHAWAAFGIMCATVAAAMWGVRRFG